MSGTLFSLLNQVGPVITFFFVFKQRQRQGLRRVDLPEGVGQAGLRHQHEVDLGLRRHAVRRWRQVRARPGRVAARQDQQQVSHRPWLPTEVAPR